MASSKIKKYKKLIFNDFSKNTTDENYTNNLLSNNCYNFNYNKKIIKTGLGISEWRFPLELEDLSEETTIDYSNLGFDKINSLLYFRQYFPGSGNTQHRILIHGSDGHLYVYQLFSGVRYFIWLYGLTFDTPPIALAYKVNGDDTLILSSREKMVVWTTDLIPYEATNVPVITSMCVSDNMLYCTVAGQANVIWLCLSSNPELIGTESAYAMSISLDDERRSANKVLTFKENLYAFRDYGITRIIYYTRSNIVIKHVYLSDSQIFANTITVCGDEILFMTRDGIYSFNGITVKKVKLGIEDLIDDINDYAVSCCLQDKYYLALRMDFKDGKKILHEQTDYKNNALIAINLSDYSFELLRGVDINQMMVLRTQIFEKILVTFNNAPQNRIGEINSSGKFLDNNLPKFYSSNYVLADNLDKVVIRKIILDASPNISIKIITNTKNSYEFNCKKDGINEFQTMIECNNFKVEFSSISDKCEVRHCEVEYFKSE